jgi:hypothetical protein
MTKIGAFFDEVSIILPTLGAWNESAYHKSRSQLMKLTRW